MRGWMEDRPSYIPPVGLGEVMRAGGVGQVVESRSPDYAVGELVQGMFGWQEYAHRRPRRLMAASTLPQGHAADLAARRPRHHRAHRLLRPARPRQAARPGETVVVSGAAGATGSVAAQIAKIQGLPRDRHRGRRGEVRWLTRASAASTRRSTTRARTSRSALRELCPKGVDVYFDNVGGEILDAALAHLAQRARVVLCGGISGYNEATPPPGPRN